MRAWVQGCKARALPSAAVNSALTAIGIGDAACALDATLRGLAQWINRRLLVQCPHCSDVSEDERLLLDAASCAQNGCFERACHLLGEIVPRGSAEVIVAPLSGLGRRLALAGIDLPLGDSVLVETRFDRASASRV